MSNTDTDHSTPTGPQSTKVLLSQRFSSGKFKVAKPTSRVAVKYRHEFQFFGDRLTRVLDDEKHRGLYMKLAKHESRGLLEQALSFVAGAKVRSKGRVFMSQFYKLKKAAEAKTKAA